MQNYVMMTVLDGFHRTISTSQLISFDLKCGTWTLKYDPLGGRGSLPTPRDKVASWIAHDKYFLLKKFAAVRKSEKIQILYFRWLWFKLAQAGSFACLSISSGRFS